ncbi:hypothetical protein WJX77_010352 [Trebouxia sp. C0004]
MHLSVQKGYLKDKGLAFDEHAWAVEHFLLNDPKPPHLIVARLSEPVHEALRNNDCVSWKSWRGALGDIAGQVCNSGQVPILAAAP